MDYIDYLANEFGISKKTIELCVQAELDIQKEFKEIENTAQFNQLKVLNAMQKNKLSEAHLGSSTGYGYNDSGRDTLEKIYADVFNTEAALVRPQIISGTHALTVALFGNLRHGDEMVSVLGKPYDTLEGVIGIKDTRGSLKEHGVRYSQVDLTNDGEIDYEKIKKTLSKNTKLVLIQRSKGYAFRKSFDVLEVKKLVAFIKNINKNIICMVDNCYCEFVDIYEPSDFQADLVVGSLIKNPGGGLSPVGGYIAGKEEYVDNAAYQLTSPGLGREVGPSLGIVPSMLQGLFIAPQVVSGALKGAVFAAQVFSSLGFEVMPLPEGKRADIVQAIKMRTPKNIIAFCQSIQKAAPVDSFVKPEPWAMPGYDCEIIMAAGAFVQGASIELSADAPIRPPYVVYFQGGLTWFHAKAGIIIAADTLLKL